MSKKRKPLTRAKRFARGFVAGVGSGAARCYDGSIIRKRESFV